MLVYMFIYFVLHIVIQIKLERETQLSKSIVDYQEQ